MRALMFAVVAMGVLIVGATVALAVLIVQRVSHSGTAVASATLDEPAGTRIASASTTADWMVLHLQGGGADRVVVVDPRSGRVVSRVSLAR